ncbi:LOW QUALITY PROTEIN: hypothetical protein T552_04203 [Pneumocystis carinii B80]|uniref:Uncharacterized protein n=1 Tax=Pneumocystis carinii (strain B80) TaxID=1408658 RepID=A0A0W4ZCA9_PNEC8|nr:LOW QUALITY PROTEIN: hypothetical protein T552_04203 [Pneumocystis carinii B80]KTW25959.1 LOW QUALITY PROTEIN: hypothetical protein T552_04203 [Pneumocystis carinii B80]
MNQDKLNNYNGCYFVFKNRLCMNGADNIWYGRGGRIIWREENKENNSENNIEKIKNSALDFQSILYRNTSQIPRKRHRIILEDK